MKAAMPVSPMAGTTVLVISPHLDDAVFACGRLLARLSRLCRVVVVTVFAGRPSPLPSSSGLTEWDRASGFRPGDDPVAARCEEDRRALARLGADHRWLSFADSQYGATPALQCVAAALARVFRRERPRCVLFPLGLFHSDHRLVHEAVLAHLRRRTASCGLRRGTRFVAFEDALYRRIPGLAAAGVQRLRRGGWRPRRRLFGGSAWTRARKDRAVACYASQLQALATPGRLGHGDTRDDEGYWCLGRLP